MNLAIDIGNTAVKWATFDEGGQRPVASGQWVTPGSTQSSTAGKRRSASPSLGENLNGMDYDRVLVCASGEVPVELAALPRLSAAMELPIRIGYKSPATLGPDRLAAACGAWALHRGENCLVIDAGTCITVDFLSADGMYHGGAIMPGLEMNLKALHTFTAKLPLISLEGVTKAPVLGRTTEESILSGTLGATMMALAGFVALYRQKSPALRVLLTGGASGPLTAAGATGWEVQPQLTLIGLNEIMRRNEK